MVWIIAVCFAVLFYRLAYHENMSGWLWAIASMAVSGIVLLLFPGLTVMVLAQMALFVILWWVNAQRLVARGERLLRAREEERRLRKERVYRAREEARRKQEGDG
jgi:hypothetical protein